MPRGCLLFLFLLPLITSKCYVDFPSGSCEDSLCVATFLHHSEGTVKRMGCVSLAKIDKKPLECKNYLTSNDTNGVCFEKGSRRTCCCNDTGANECNRVWEEGFQWPQLEPSEMMFLLTCICLVLLLPVSIERLLPADQEEQVAAEVADSFLLCERTMFRLKAIFFLIFGIAAWFPFFRDCGSHQEGEFQSKLFFIAQVISNPYLGFSLTTFPFVNIFWDCLRFGTTRIHGAPFRRQSKTSLLLSLLFSSITALFLLKAIQLWKEDKVTERHCRVGAAIWQIFAAGGFMVLYLVAVLVHEGWLFRLRRINDQSLWQDANEARSREFNTAMCYDEVTAVETALSNTTVKEEDHIDFSPRPFSLDSNGEAVLTISNLHPQDWIAIRILCSIPHKYAIHPSKLVIPPLRAATVSVRYLDIHSSEKRPALMIQWYTVGTSAPPMDAAHLWKKPHLRHRSQWKFFVLPIFHEM